MILFMKKDKQYHLRRVLASAMMLMLPILGFSQATTTQGSTSVFSNALFNALLFVIIVLAIMVIAIGGALKNVIGSDLFIEKLKRDKENESASKSLVLLCFFLLAGLNVYSQNTNNGATNNDLIGGLEQSTFYLMLSVIGAELLVLGILFNTFKSILGVKKPVKHPDVAPIKKPKTIFDKINGTIEIELEESIMLDHDYDGIKELDNNLPPWWKYGFYLTILIAVIYLVNYHVAKTSPLQAEEYTNSIKKAEIEVAAYIKNSANNVDENTVKMLSDASDLAAGKDLFLAVCAACHGKYGEGTVGPNLTDAYWIHGGGVRDIFKTIKYGWPDKGMKSWKDDYSPVQIAQLTSYVRTLIGTNPEKPKDKQGELYIEEIAPADSSALIKTDTAIVAVSQDTSKIK